MEAMCISNVFMNVYRLTWGHIIKAKNVKLSLQQAVEAPTFSRHSTHRWRSDCQPYDPAALYPQEDSWFSFLLEAESTPGPLSDWKD
jgi:hypothetical protein